MRPFHALDTVNSEFFARVLFSRNFAYAKFCENKTLAKWQNHSDVYWYTYIMPKSRISNVANMSLNAIRDNKDLAKISEFTVNDQANTTVSQKRNLQGNCSIR